AFAEVWQRRLGHLEHAEDVGAEGLFPLLLGDVLEALLRVLLGGVVDQDVEPAERGYRLIDHLAADILVGHVAGEGQAAAPLLLYHAACFVGILILIQIEDHHIGALACEQHRHRAADAAVAARDDRHLVLQLAGGLVILATEFRARCHFIFLARLRLLLRGHSLLLVGHAESSVKRMTWLRRTGWPAEKFLAGDERQPTEPHSTCRTTRPRASPLSMYWCAATASSKGNTLSIWGLTSRSAVS